MTYLGLTDLDAFPDPDPVEFLCFTFDISKIWLAAKAREWSTGRNGIKITIEIEIEIGVGIIITRYVRRQEENI